MSHAQELSIQDELDLVVMYPNVDDEREPAAKYHNRAIFLQFRDGLGVSEEDVHKGMKVHAVVADVNSDDGPVRAIVTEVGE